MKSSLDQFYNTNVQQHNRISIMHSQQTNSRNSILKSNYNTVGVGQQSQYAQKQQDQGQTRAGSSSKNSRMTKEAEGTGSLQATAKETLLNSMVDSH